MTPMQTLVRLAELTRLIDNTNMDDPHLPVLRAERDRILAAVPSVPRELEGVNDAGLWAHMLEQRYPCTAPSGILEVWFAAALSSGRLDGIKEGSTLGHAQRSEAHGAAVGTLELIAGLLDDGKLMDLLLRGSEPGSEPIKLSAVIAEALLGSL